MLAFESMPVESRPYKLRRAIPSPYYTCAPGIYAIVNRGNGKVYIGSAVRLNHRWTEHRCNLEDGEHHSRYLQRAFNKTPDAFEVEVIEELPNADKQKLLSREQFWMDFYRSYLPEHGYNISPNASSCQGIKRSPEFLEKISAAKRGKKYTPERMLAHMNRRRSTKLRSFTPEQREQCRQRKLGKPNSPEARRKISEWHQKYQIFAKPVLQYSMEGHFIKKFDSVKDAEIACGCKSGNSNIYRSCDERSRSSLGFVWRYFTGEIAQSITVRPKGGPKRGVVKSSIDGIDLVVYRTIRDAAKSVGLSDCPIRRACEHNVPKKGFLWRFSNA